MAEETEFETIEGVPQITPAVTTERVETPESAPVRTVTARRVSPLRMVALAVAALVMIAGLAPMIYAAQFARPSMDDFMYSAWTYQALRDGGGFFSAVWAGLRRDWFFFNNWQGLYTAAFLLAMQPGVWGMQYYGWGALALLLLELLSTLFFVATLRKCFKMDRWVMIFYPLFFMVWILMGIPHLVQGLYWYNGTWNYMPFFFLDLLNVSIILRYFNRGERPGTVYLVLSSILSFVISGGNHLMSTLNIMLLFLAVVMGLIYRKDGGALIPLVVALVGFAIMFFAPGTANRQGALAKQTVPDTLRGSAIQTWRMLNQWCNVRVVLGMAGSTPLALQIARRDTRTLPMLHPLLMCIGCIAMFFVVWCVPYYPMGNFGMGRTINVAWCTYMALIAFNWVYALVWLNRRVDYAQIADRLSGNVAWGIVAILLAGGVCVVNHGNVLLVLRDLRSGEAEVFAREFDERMEYLESIDPASVPEGESIEIDPLTVKPESLLFDDFEDWAYEEYFGFAVTMRDPEPEDATAAEDEAAADTEDEAAAGAEDDAESGDAKDEKAEAKDAKN